MKRKQPDLFEMVRDYYAACTRILAAHPEIRILNKHLAKHGLEIQLGISIAGKGRRQRARKLTIKKDGTVQFSGEDREAFQKFFNIEL